MVTFRIMVMPVENSARRASPEENHGAKVGRKKNSPATHGNFVRYWALCFSKYSSAFFTKSALEAAGCR